MHPRRKVSFSRGRAQEPSFLHKRPSNTMSAPQNQSRCGQWGSGDLAALSSCSSMEEMWRGTLQESSLSQMVLYQIGKLGLGELTWLIMLSSFPESITVVPLAIMVHIPPYQLEAICSHFTKLVGLSSETASTHF